MNILVSKILTFDKAPLERRRNAEELGKYLDTEPYIGGTDTLSNFINICKSVGQNDLLYLEDDVQICSEFPTRIKEAIEEYPDKVITFFYPRSVIQKKPIEVNFSQYQFSQCVYIPNKYISKLIQLEPRYRNNYYIHNDWERIFRLLDGTYIRYFPHLVQQYNWKSTIFPGFTDSGSKYFVG